MPRISALGGMSSRGVGQFSGGEKPQYIEDYFSTYLYDGTGAEQKISNEIGLANTASWSSYKLFENVSIGFGITTDNSGNVYVTGRANDGSNYIILAKYDSSGAIQWQRKLREGSSAGASIATDSSGNVYVTGNANDGSNYIILAKYNTSGVIQWQRKLRQNASTGQGVATDSSGNIYVTGVANDGSNYIILAKYDSSGAIQWQRKLREGSSTGLAVATDSSGNVYVTGLANNVSNYIIVAKYNTSGVIQWQRNIQQGSASSAGRGIATDSSGNVYVTGNTSDGSNYIIIIKYNTSGVIQWQRKLRQLSSIGYGITTDSSGNVYVTGIADSGTNDYIIVAKYDTSGVIQWQRKLRQNPSTGFGVATDNLGNIYVTGYADNVTDTYIVVSKLAQDGSTSSGTAFVSLEPGPATDSAGTATDSAGAATDSAGTATDADGTATDSAGTATASIATQPTVSGAEGLVWIKARSTTTGHFLFDTLRGPLVEVNSETTAIDTTLANSLLAFNADGFTVGGATGVGASAVNYLSFSFKTAEKFFDIVTYTGTGSLQTIQHNLKAVPGYIFIKARTSAQAWAVYYGDNTRYMVLNTTAASVASATYWNNTSPTDTVFTVNTAAPVNSNGVEYVAYLFANNAGGFGDDLSQSAVVSGTYTGNGSATGPIVTLGFEPQWILIKAIGAATGWYIYNNVTGLTYAGTDFHVVANTTAAEAGTVMVSPMPDGFQLNTTTLVNATSVTYSYLAIRRGPMRAPTDATKVFQPVVYTGTNVDNRLVNTTIAPDMVWARQRNDTVLGGMVVGDRNRGTPYLLTGTTAVEVNDADSFMTPTALYGNAFASNNGFGVGNDVTSKLNVSTVASNQVAEAFKRAPLFFDIVGYTGNGSSQNIPHNLGQIPELTIIKRRSTAVGNWRVATLAGIAYQLVLNTTAGFADAGANAIAITSTEIQLNSGADVNASGSTYVAYLFGTCPGVSKIGSYAGTGTTQQIDCGFTSGARFVLIKRTDTTGSWYIWDSARGIVAGNDPYLRLNDTAAEVTNTDYVDTYSAGFELSSTAIADLNEAPGITWLSITTAINFGTSIIWGVSYVNNIYIAVGADGKLATSLVNRAESWTQRTSNFGTTTIYDVAYGNGIYVAVGASGKISTSPTGTTWTARTSGTAQNLLAITYGNGRFLAVGSAGTIISSLDGITWTTETGNFGTTAIRDVVYANGNFVAVGDAGKLSTSSDGVTWAAQTSGFGTDDIYGITYGNGLFVICGTTGKISTSPDAITWTSRTSGVTTNLTKLAYGSGIYVVVGLSGVLRTSPDGVTWTSRTSGFSSNAIYDVTSNGTYFVAVGNAGTATRNEPKYTYLAIA